MSMTQNRDGLVPDKWLAKLTEDGKRASSVFFYDARTKTIRNHQKPKYVLGNQEGEGTSTGKWAAFRKWSVRSQPDQKMKLGKWGVKMYQTDDHRGNCLTTMDAAPPRDFIQLSWYTCVTGSVFENDDQQKNIVQVPKNVSMKNVHQAQKFKVIFAHA